MPNLPPILRRARTATLNFGFPDTVEAFLLVCASAVTTVTAVIRASAVWVLDIGGDDGIGKEVHLSL